MDKKKGTNKVEISHLHRNTNFMTSELDDIGIVCRRTSTNILFVCTLCIGGVVNGGSIVMGSPLEHIKIHQNPSKYIVYCDVL